MPLRARPEIEKLAPAAHGGPDYAELNASGFKPEDVMDFSVCSNPYIPPPELSGLVASEDIGRLPDSEAIGLRGRLSKSLGVPATNILAANGSTELIRLVALAYFGRGDTVLVLEPTFGEYEVACRISGADVIKQIASEEAGFAQNISEIIARIKKSRAKGVFICNPNNPTGRYLGRSEIEAVLDACPETLLVLDEAYTAFVLESWNSLELTTRENLVILRSMTKDYALGGLRLGYAVANRKIIDILRRINQPWNVNVVAQQAGIAALDEQVSLERSLHKTWIARGYLVVELRKLGYKPLPSETHFFLMKVGNAQEFRAALLKQGMLVRDCASFGLPEYIRIAARTLPECRKLIAAIKALKKNKIQWKQISGGE